MGKKNLVRISAIAVAIALIASIIGGAVVSKRVVSKPNDDKVWANEMQKSNNVDIISNEQSSAENLKFKIGELWRLSLNSDLDLDLKNSINTLNQNFDASTLANAIQKTDEEFDVIADEYLAAIQMDLDFMLYLNDYAAYENAKSETKYSGVILTIKMIDEYLNKLNTEEAENIVNHTNDETINVPNVEVPNIQPELPKAGDILPKNPADEIKAEIENITNR